MKPDRIQLASQLGNEQGTVIRIMTTYPVKDLNQSAILAGVFSDLVKEPMADQVAMIVEAHQLKVIVTAAGGTFTEAELGLIVTFNAFHAMIVEERDESPHQDLVPERPDIDIGRIEPSLL